MRHDCNVTLLFTVPVPVLVFGQWSFIKSDAAYTFDLEDKYIQDVLCIVIVSIQATAPHRR